MPTLEQMRAIATDLGLPAGALPPLAGAAPSWILMPPGFFEESAVAREPNVNRSFTTGNLLTVDAPTLMTEWQLTAINLICGGFFTSPEAAPPAGSVVTLTAQLLLGGDVVWSHTIESPVGAKGKFGEAPRLAFSENFNSPIVVPRGRTLAIRLTVAANQKSEALGVNLEGGPPIVGSQQLSSISYTVRHLTGRREL